MKGTNIPNILSTDELSTDELSKIIPVIDVSEGFSVFEICEALTTIGFFIVTGSGIDSNALLQEADSFFDKSLNKKKCVTSNSYRGYSELGSEVTLGIVDWHECLDLMSEQKNKDLPFFGVNPTLDYQLENMIEIYMKDMTMLCSNIVKAICNGLSVTELEDNFTDPFLILRLLRYPEQPEQPEGKHIENKIGIGEHSDYGCVTLVASDVEGLQVKTLSGDWINAPVIPGAFVCNIGDALSSWTTGIARATPHRVITSKKRTSVAFFFEPSLSSPMGTSDYGSYLLGKYEASYPQNPDVIDK